MRMSDVASSVAGLAVGVALVAASAAFAVRRCPQGAIGDVLVSRTKRPCDICGRMDVLRRSDPGESSSRNRNHLRNVTESLA